MPRGRIGGRIIDQPNRGAAEVEEKLASLSCDPIAGMAKLAMDESLDPGLRGQMYKELAQYVAAKRKAFEVSSQNETRLTIADLVATSYDTGAPSSGG